MLVGNISVISTVKNGSGFVKNLVKSVLEDQYFPPIEFIIVDDGSTDDTAKILKQLKEDYSALKVIFTEGIGRAKALNLAINNAKGDWVANIDVDDMWHPRKLELQVKAIRDNTHINILCTWAILAYDDDPVDFAHLNRSEEGQKLPISNLTKEFFYKKNPVNHSSTLIKKSTYNQFENYNESLSKQIDLDMWHRFLIGNESIYNLDIPLTVKRKHSGQSFEASGISYINNAYRLQFSFLKRVNAPFYAIFYMNFKYIYHLLPERLKRLIRGVSL